MPDCIYWLKRDFRLFDNPALTAALDRHRSVTPLFILEPSDVAAPETSGFHLMARSDAFNGLHERIVKGGGQLGFAHREVVELLDELYDKEAFTHLVSHRETGGNRTYDRDRAVASWCARRGVTWTEHQQTGVFRGGVDRDRRHRRWQTFYKAEVLPEPTQLGRLVVPEAWAELLEYTTGREALPAHQHDFLGSRVRAPLNLLKRARSRGQWSLTQPVNEAAAHETLATFLAGRAANYSKGMSSPNTAPYHCSRLSVHLAWGTMSGRAAYQLTKKRTEELKAEGTDEAKTLARNLRSFLSRLHWRDHFSQRLETEVAMEHRPLNPNFWGLELENDPAKLDAWIGGRTGYPMVDACIRCMAQTGYINFRMRAMLTSVAAHMLHLDYRRIDKPMARLYTDYEPGIHLAQLQMQAGMVGINTLRTYSPEKQFTDHDPEATFIHEWIPELRDFTARQIAKRDLTIGLGDYPAAIVDRMPRVRAYKKLINDLKYREGGREINERVFAKHGSRKGPPRKQKKSD